MSSPIDFDSHRSIITKYWVYLYYPLGDRDFEIDWFKNKALQCGRNRFIALQAHTLPIDYNDFSIFKFQNTEELNSSSHSSLIYDQIEHEK